MGSIYIMSIRPRYANAILDYTKKFELRRLDGLEPISEGSVIVIYVSGNIQSIVGEFIAGRVYIGSPEKIWSLVSSGDYGITEEAWKYIEGSRKAMAVEVLNPRRYPLSVKLESIRRILPGWNPPHSYSELREGDPFYELILKPVRSLIVTA
ncbi:MAG: hypothetical protein QXD97_07220 [Acidilobaceae archaeon]